MQESKVIRRLRLLLMAESSKKPEKLKIRKKCYFLSARDMKSLMYPCFFLCFIAGLFPYKTEVSSYVSSKIRFACSTLIMALYTSYLLVVLYQIDFSGTLEYNSLPGTLQANCYVILGGCIALVTYILSWPRLRAIQNISEISLGLSSKNFDSLARWIHAKDMIGFLFIIAHIPNVYNKNIYECLSKTISMYTTLVVFLMDMFYMNCVCVLKACFGRINESLLNLKEILITEEPHLLRRVYHEQKNPLLLIELRALKKRHLQISDVLQVFNNTFSLQIMASVILTFVEITFSLYFFILCQFSPKEINLEKQIWYSYFITSVAYYSVKITVMIWACETGKDQASQIGTNIHEVLINTFDKQVKDELELFSLQVLHRDNTFSAKGLTMDATLLSKIVSGITTYLLILIQFQLTNEITED